MYPFSSNGLNYEDEESVYFFTTAFYPLDPFSAHPIEIWGNVFATAEHAYHWKKYEKTNASVAERIREAASPELVKRIADANKTDVPEDWHDHKVEHMYDIFYAKAQQHADVCEVLEKTEGRNIIENSPVDDFWGAGPHGDGENMLGEVWMKVRGDLGM